MLQLYAVIALIFGCFGVSSATCGYPILLAGKSLITSSSDSNQPTCPSSEQRELALGELNVEVDSIISSQLPLLERFSFPLECPGQGWIKVVDFDLKANQNDSCPGDWEKHPSQNFCTHSSSINPTCESANFSTNNTAYSRVCGRMRGYQIGKTSGFQPYVSNMRPNLDGTYLDGVSITHGNPRVHIWSFVSGETSSSSDTNCPECICPCVDDTGVTLPSYLNGNFSCNSGSAGNTILQDVYGDNPLWDGEGCEPGNECCAQSRFFATDLGGHTCDDLELRLCVSGDLRGANVGIDQIEIYVK